MVETRYAKSGDVSIAYQIVGEGPFDVVFVPGFVSHLDVNHEVRNIAEVIARFASFSRGITFDKRGTGLSDRTVGLPNLADRMDDIRAVMDAVGSERAAIVGMSEGGPVAAMFAATYPGRVTALVLWATALGPPLEERDEASKAAAALFDAYIGERWGDGSTMRFLIGGGAPGDRAIDELFGRYERNAATPAAAQAVLRRSYEVDARPVAATLDVPTLLVAHRSDPIVQIDQVRKTAAAVRGARLVETDAAGHWSWDIAEHADLDVIEEFLTGARRASSGRRMLATVMFTDIVGSTERAFALGDTQWRNLLDEHDVATRRQIAAFGGREIKTTGDGFVASFDGPARGVQCALAIVHDVHRLGLDLRAGLHTAECEVRGNDLVGAAVHIGARVAAMAQAGEVLASRTVMDLVTGSGIRFEDRGEHELKGVPGSWKLYAVQA